MKKTVLYLVLICLYQSPLIISSSDPQSTVGVTESSSAAPQSTAIVYAAPTRKQSKQIKKQQKQSRKKQKKAARKQPRVSSCLQPRTLIWDLGNTLLRASRFGMAQEIGLRDFALYKLWDGKDPVHIQELAFKILDELKGQTCTHAVPQNGKLPIPALMCEWFLGTTSGKIICEKVNAKIEELDAKKYFFNDREKRLVAHMVEVMLHPEKLAEHMKPIKPAVRILAECSMQLNSQGQPLHEMLILSNWDPASFDYLYNTAHGKRIFEYFKPENIVISGDIGLIKPDPAIYNYIIQVYKLDPHTCIVIDDQQENINAAQAVGMTGLLLEDFDYKKLRKQLQQLHVL